MLLFDSPCLSNTQVSLLQNKSVVVSSSGAEDENGVTVSVLETTIDASEGTEIVTEEATEVTVNTEMVVQDEEGKVSVWCGGGERDNNEKAVECVASNLIPEFGLQKGMSIVPNTC